MTKPRGWSAVRREHRNPFAVRAAVRHGVGHCLKEIFREVTLKADNSAHFNSSSEGGTGERYRPLGDSSSRKEFEDDGSDVSPIAWPSAAMILSIADSTPNCASA